MSIQQISLWTCDVQSPACESRPLADSYGELRAERYEEDAPGGWAENPNGTHVCDRCQDFYRLQSYPVGAVVGKGVAPYRTEWERRVGGWHRLTYNLHGTYTNFDSADMVGYDYQPIDPTPTSH